MLKFVERNVMLLVLLLYNASIGRNCVGHSIIMMRIKEMRIQQMSTETDDVKS